MNDRLAGVGVIAVDLEATGRTLSGTWTVTFQDAVRSGEVLGVAVDEVAVLVMYDGGEQGCRVQADVERVAGQLIGEHATEGCTGMSRGDIVLGLE